MKPRVPSGASGELAWFDGVLGVRVAGFYPFLVPVLTG